MKKFLVILSSIAFIAVISLSVTAQEPEKKAEKAKTEKCCTKEESKKCPSTCDKKATDAKKEMKEEKKAEKK